MFYYEEGKIMTFLSNQPKLISLFCGGGGLDQGFKEAKFITSLAYDIDEACVITHNHNHPEARARKVDLSTISVENVILDWESRLIQQGPVGVIGGPPCQSFSVSNVHQSDSDPRHMLPEAYARILKGLNQHYGLDFFVFENVPGLVNSKHVQKFLHFIGLFEDAGFNIFEGSLNAKDFGVAQDRQRVFVVGINKQKHPNLIFKFPEPYTTQYKTVREEIENLPEPTYFRKGLSRDQIPYHPNHWCLQPKSAKFSNGRMKPGEVLGRSFRVLPWDEPSYTVAYGHREVHVHPNCKRRLSVFEAMKLQGFPESYELLGTLSDQIRIISEAVAPPVASAIAKELGRQLNLIPIDYQQDSFPIVQD